MQVKHLFYGLSNKYFCCCSKRREFCYVNFQLIFEHSGSHMESPSEDKENAASEVKVKIEDTTVNNSLHAPGKVLVSSTIR